MSSSSSAINISTSEAISLEIKLNVSEYGRKWSDLGDILFKCRINPKVYQVDKTEYNISNDQANWIKSNINLDNYPKSYKLFY